MRALILLSLVACAEPPRRPPQQPADPNSVNGCRSSPTALHGVRYTCSTYEVLDNTMEEGTSLRQIEDHLVTSARARGFEATTRAFDVPGAEDALLIEYRQRDGYAFDVLAANPVDTKLRVIQCQMSWFDNARSLATRQETCKSTLNALFARPAPSGANLSPECTRATNKLSKLPGRVEPKDGSEELRGVMVEFAARCTDKIAACALAAKTYVEATLCRD